MNKEKEIKKLTIRVPNELHREARRVLFNQEKTFQKFTIEALEKLVKAQ